MKAIRGAVNFCSDTAEEIAAKTIELFDQLIKVNNLLYKDMVCVIFSLTADITAAYPAATFRQKFSASVPLFSCLEPNIKDGMPLTLRVLILHEGESSTPVYLYETKKLRKDLFYENRN
ncbi:MAG: chorismate mutase [Clostridia bacterium]|nr:chorismate mutase [Clostridia bacterium]